MSASTIDRILKPIKTKSTSRGLDGTKPGSLVRNRIPIKTNQWEEEKVGFIEADSVAHCGRSLKGDFIRLINDLYRKEWSLYQNHFIPTMKCVEKKK